MLTRILIVGDSQVESALKTYGFGSILNDRFNGEADIILRKFPGYTAEWIKLLVSSVARNLGATPDYVIVLCGRDDCLRSNQDKRPVTDPDKFRKHLYSLGDKITNEVDMNMERFIFLSPFPIHSMRFEGSEDNISNGLSIDKSTLRFYAEKTNEVAKRVGGQFVDTSELLDRALDANFERDGIKLSKDGHMTLAEKLIEMIKLTESPFPSYDKIGQDYEKQLGEISQSCSLVQAENIAAYTYVSTVDQYSAYLKKTKQGKV